VLYIFSLGIGMLILDRSPHGTEEFKTILNGNIIWTTGTDLFYTFILYAAIGIFHFIFRKKFLASPALVKVAISGNSCFF